MAYNSSASSSTLEDSLTQNWPFSVRYTASPYRKSKFPVQNPNSISSISPQQLPGTRLAHHTQNTGNNNNSNPSNFAMHHHHHRHPHQHLLHQHQQAQLQHQVPHWSTSPPGFHLSLPNRNGNTGVSTISNNGPRIPFHPTDPTVTSSNAYTNEQFLEQRAQLQYQKYCYLRQQHQQILQQQHQQSLHHQTHNPAHNYYGLPEHSNAQPNVHLNYSVDGNNYLDEGYIEELKQCPNPGAEQNFQNPRELSSYDPYSYVYDSQLLGPPESLGPGILEKLQRECVVMGNSQGRPPSSSRAYYQQHSSENEYEEIRDVARYMSNNNSGSGSGSDSFEMRPRPLHFKSFSSTDDILSEVNHVQQGHNRVLDQLNLEVENLLIRSSTEVEQFNHNHNGPSYSNVNNNPGEYVNGAVNNVLGLPLPGINEQLVPYHAQSQSMDSCLQRYNKKDICPKNGNTSKMISSSSSSGFLISTITNTNGNGNLGPATTTIAPHHSKSKSETCGSFNSCVTGPGSSGSNNVSQSSGILSFGRRKKLDRATGPACQLEISSLKSYIEQSENDKLGPIPLPKIRHHRSYSIIPNWKIRDHLMRLPFLKNDKLKKNNIVTTNSISSSGPGSEEGGSLDGYSTNKKQKGKNKSSAPVISNKKSPLHAIADDELRINNFNNLTTKMAASVKARSSSMDELRTTGPEEHWYSADSDTEPDSLTALPQSKQEILAESTEGNGNLSNHQSTISSANSFMSLGLNSTNNGGVNGSSRLDHSPVIPTIENVPKAPKFRRGSGIKDKWRESWTSSKTLSKSNMDPGSGTNNSAEDNRLLRWFSLRKNQSSTNIVDGASTNNNRHSTLPLLSEEDLKRISMLEDEEGYWPRRTVLPPTLPVPPLDLTSEQITRRHIVAAIVHSENNYVAALQRLVNEYKKPLECSHPAMLSHNKISTVFHRLPEILQCHSLFRIALAEYIRKWDSDEKIGDVFVASFSKSLVLDVYSEFINNFGTAMETAKSEARRKSTFAEFLKVKQMTAHDRLSLFGLMVKPVQRFPQFILLLQDLLKHTPKDHHDRMSLQLALTQLESLAAMLNERKRESEQYLAFRETMKSIGGGKFVLLRTINDDPSRILLRQDLVTQLEFEHGSHSANSNGNSGSGGTGSISKSKNRKLLLLNDMLICVSVSGASTLDGRRGSKADYGVPGNNMGKSEKCIFKWSYPVREVEIEDISISPTMSRFVNTNTSTSSLPGVNTHGSIGNLTEPDSGGTTSLLEEMQSLMYDYSVLSRISELVKSLKSSYDGLSESLIRELMLEIQYQIRCRDEQLSYFDSSCLTLLLGTGTNREKVVFQMTSPTARNEWIEELKLAQLALDPNNSPSWDIPLESPYPSHRLPLFVKALPLCRSPHLNIVKCGCFFTHTFVSPTGRSKILDQLWVSCTDGISSHITAFRSQQASLKETVNFDLMEEKVNDIVFVNGYVWMGTESRKILIFDPSDHEKGSVTQVLLADSILKLTLFGNVIYAGLADGTVAIFTNIQNPVGNTLEPEKILKVGNDRVPAMFGSRDHIYASCGNAVVTIDVKTHTIERNVVLTHHHGPITHMACSGVGLWITTQDSGTVCLYHLESLQHLQDVNIAPSVFRTIRDSFRRQKGCFVTCLSAHKGWLWIGTNLGVILTIPLPRLEGVPIISTGKANVSYHGYSGPVTFLMPLAKVPNPPPISTNPVPKLPKTEEKLPFDNNDLLKTPTRANVTFDEKDITLTPANGNGSLSSPDSKSPSLSNSSSFNDSKPGSSSGIHSLDSLGLVQSKVILRKKNSRDNFLSTRNCKTLPRGGPLPANLRFSIDSDVYGLYGNLINVRGLDEEEGRFVDPLYDSLRRSDPELQALDSRNTTIDRRLRMRMSRPRSLDLSNWSVDSKVSVSSDESGSRSSSQATENNLQNNAPVTSPIPPANEKAADNSNCNFLGPNTSTPANKKTIARSKTIKSPGGKTGKTPSERTIIVVVGGKGYINMKQESNHYGNIPISDSDSSSKQCTHLTLWQMKA